MRNQPYVFKIVKEASNALTERVGFTKSRSLHMTGAACIGNAFVGMGKLVMGILSLSRIIYL